MATLHMDVETMHAIAAQLKSDHETMADLIISMNSKIDGLVGSSWIAPSANQFQSDFHVWAGNERNLLAEFNELINRLQDEINDWETTALSL